MTPNELAAKGFRVFPVPLNAKLPPVADFPTRATLDKAQIDKWFSSPRNIGLYAGDYRGRPMLVVDVDVKHGKDGRRALLTWELEGKELPSTYTVATATGGKHLYFLAPHEVAPSVGKLALGIDIRSHNSYVLAPGSEIDGVKYTVSQDLPLAEAPAWLIEACELPAPRCEAEIPASVDNEKAEARAKAYLTQAPTAIEGESGDAKTYLVAAKLKDLGCTYEQTLDLMASNWNDNCQPPWSYDELADKVRNAYRYGKEAPGCRAPEAVFPPAPEAGPDEMGTPFEEMNRRFAFIFAGGTGNVLWETTDSQGRDTFHLMNRTSFFDMEASKKIQINDKFKSLAEEWYAWSGRRSYDGIVFEPGRDAGPRWYNMWRGFCCKPAETSRHPMVERWKEHLLTNICRGDRQLADWLTSWFAHLIQKPGEKPLVAVVFKGTKGVGKNACVERVSHLLGGHAMITSRRRYLVSNFTMHLQKSLMFILDEAFWSGDKEAEGVVKDLITGSEHDIEPKGKESYRVRNLTRVVVIGNEDWLIPASHDERRWAVFDVGESRKQDRQYFEEMRVGLDEKGGDAYLLRYLMDYPITQDINVAPNTAALIDQKHASLDPLAQWWLECLMSGCIVGGDWAGEWLDSLPTNRLRDALNRWAKLRNIRARLPEVIGFGRGLKKMCPGITRVRVSAKQEADSTYVLTIPDLESARAAWEKYIGGHVNWSE